MSVRSNQSSKGSLSLYEGSGKNNIFFSTAPNHFTIAKIAVPSRDLRLTFGAQRYSQGGSNQFITSDFEVRLSADGQMWSQKLDYDFGGVADDPGQWRLATADFTLPEGTSTLTSNSRLRSAAPIASTTCCCSRATAVSRSSSAPKTKCLCRP